MPSDGEKEPVDCSLRPIQASEQEAALDLWNAVFRPLPDYFRRYFTADPWYREGDCLGAWDGTQLVSAVHICRRPLEWKDQTTWCGGIANVATREEYRCRGLSRSLLRLAIERMEQTGIAFSMLGTGRHGHYGALGWKVVPLPYPVVTLSLASEGSHADQNGSALQRELDPVAPSTEFASRIYSNPPCPPLQLHRLPCYFEGWVGWHWRHTRSEMLQRDRGYALLQCPVKPEEPARLIEWRSLNVETEQALFEDAARLARTWNKEKLALAALPQFPETRLDPLGELSVYHREGTMMRNIRLPQDRYTRLIQLYSEGQARWWQSDGF